jgi:flavin reductase (DIM6/NTAB) family NADH-FMN oxidoreductase RutF
MAATGTEGEGSASTSASNEQNDGQDQEEPLAPRPGLGPEPAPEPASGSTLRYGNPWADPPANRDPVRRLRGHMVLPVTVWLAHPLDGDGPAVGLTVSSVVVSEGEPAMLAGLVAPLSDLADAVDRPPGRFVVHLLGGAHRRLAQHFAGGVPAPAEMLTASHSAHGPLLDAVGDRLLCHAVSTKPFGWSLLVEAEVDDVHTAQAGRGLAWYHGSFLVVAGPD